MNMKCPVCNVELEKAIFQNVEVDFCPICLGMFFEKEELRVAKDEKDNNLVWLDIDLWKDKRKFKISKANLLCPVCQLPLYTVFYGDSKIEVDICSICQGVWLDRGEFRKIIEYLKEKAKYEILKNYFKNLAKEIAEVFVGPEPLREEILDVITILKLLNYKFAVQFPILIEIISALPK